MTNADATTAPAVRIAPVDFFTTPRDWREMEAWLMNLHGAERAVATIAAMMAWNLAAKIVNEEGTT
jgi:hypothetical protein